MAIGNTRFTNNLNVPETLRVLQSIDSTTQEKIIPIDYGLEDLNKLRLKAPFLEWLESNGSVHDTQTEQHKYKVHTLTNRAGFSGEYGTDMSQEIGINRDDMPETYGTAVIDTKTIKTSDLFNYTSIGASFNTQVQDEAVSDLQTGIDEGIFKATGNYVDKKFDGLQEKASNVIDLHDEPITIDIVNDGILQIMDNHGLPNIIVGTGRAVQQMIDSDEHQKIYATDMPLTLGNWGNMFQSNAGQTPILVDPNINNRGFDIDTGDEVYILDSTAYEIRFLVRQFMKQLADTDLATNYKFASFVSSCLKVPEWCTRITGIGATEGFDFLTVNVTDSVSGNPVKGATVTISGTDQLTETGITNNQGKAVVSYKPAHDITLAISKTGYTTYSENIASADISSPVNAQLVPS